jgi:hypothetical protein
MPPITWAIEDPCSPSSAVACYGGWTSCRETGDPPKGWGVLTKSGQSPKCKEVDYCNALAVHFHSRAQVTCNSTRTCNSRRHDLAFSRKAHGLIEAAETLERLF